MMSYSVIIVLFNEHTLRNRIQIMNPFKTKLEVVGQQVAQLVD